VHGTHDDDVNRQPNNSTDSAGAQAPSAADQIKRFGGVDLLDAGLRAAQRGWEIFPCNGKKEPLTPHGFKDATTDEQQIKAWAKSLPGALWGYALPKEIVVIDLDMKHGCNGIREFEKLQHSSPYQFGAPCVRTRSGGLHLYTDAGGQEHKLSYSTIAPGIDTRTFGGYVIIPSGPQSGYRWLSNNIPLPLVPPWAAVTRVDFKVPELPINGKPYQGKSLFGDMMLDRACDAIRTAPGGEQEYTLNNQSYLMGRYVGGGLLECEPTISELIKAASLMRNYDRARPWTDEQIRFKVCRAVHKGTRKPLDDGTEIDRLTQEAFDRLFNDPQYAKEVEAVLDGGQS
jgi:putative DNA primase/helicase